jgi:hypothetical protein
MTGVSIMAALITGHLAICMRVGESMIFELMDQPTQAGVMFAKRETSPSA